MFQCFLVLSASSQLLGRRKQRGCSVAAQWRPADWGHGLCVRCHSGRWQGRWAAFTGTVVWIYISTLHPLWKPPIVRWEMERAKKLWVSIFTMKCWAKELRIHWVSQSRDTGITTKDSLVELDGVHSLNIESPVIWFPCPTRWWPGALRRMAVTVRTWLAREGDPKRLRWGPNPWVKSIWHRIPNKNDSES